MPYYSKRDLLGKLKELGIALDKRRGQCYLIDQNIIHLIISYADPDPELDTILEIGAGLGILSDALIETSRQTYLLENDGKIGDYLARHYADTHPTLVIDEGNYSLESLPMLVEGKRVILLRADALKIRFPRVTKIVANIPYQISAPRVFKIIDEWAYERVILMVQKEFARRMVAKVNTKEYSRLGAAVGLFLDVKVLKEVSPSCFFPPPKVTSAIIELRKKHGGGDGELKERWRKSYLGFLRGIFPYKNRTLRNALKFYFKNDPHASEKLRPLSEGLKNPDNNAGLKAILDRRVRSLAPDALFYFMLYGFTDNADHLTRAGAVI